MPRADELYKMLKEEFGINGERELNEAIRRQGFINLAPFCPLIKEEERERHDAPRTVQTEATQRDA